MQAVLQAAYLRQLLGVPPAGSKHPVEVLASPAAAANSGSSGDGSTGAAGIDLQWAVAESGSLARSSLMPFISQVRRGRGAAGDGGGAGQQGRVQGREACCWLSGAQRTGGRMGIASCFVCREEMAANLPMPPLLPPVVQLRERGWQLAPFMLSSTEKQRYLPL